MVQLARTDHHHSRGGGSWKIHIYDTQIEARLMESRVPAEFSLRPGGLVRHGVGTDADLDVQRVADAFHQR
jgi:hypothetical protein